jgi:(p)ppGpp synthase/HD superfamily hydrolase
LLHDTAEDQGGKATLAEIREKFGADVARIVEECSDTLITPKPPWRQRKQNYIDHLAEASDSALLISVADKLHNARSILWDLREVGDQFWQRFNQKDAAQASTCGTTSRCSTSTKSAFTTGWSTNSAAWSAS